jgi:hypothetical protein
VTAATQLLIDGERSPHDRLDDQAATDVLDRHIAADDLAVFQNADRLQVQAKLADRDPGRLASVTAQILGLTLLAQAAASGGLIVAVDGVLLRPLDPLVLLESAHDGHQGIERQMRLSRRPLHCETCFREARKCNRDEDSMQRVRIRHPEIS